MDKYYVKWHDGTTRVVSYDYVKWHDGTTRVVSYDVVCGSLNDESGAEDLWQPSVASHYGVKARAIYKSLPDPEEASDLSMEGLLNRLDRMASRFHRYSAEGANLISGERMASVLDEIVAEYRAGDEQ